MTPSNSSALRLPASASPMRRERQPDPRSLAAERMAARRRRIRTIRKWVAALAVALFLSLVIVIGSQTQLVSSISSVRTSSPGSASSPTVVTRSSSTPAASTPSSLATTSGAATSTPLTTSQS